MQIEIVAFQPQYFAALEELQRRAYPLLDVQELMTVPHFESQYRIFPEGQVVAVAHGPEGARVVGMGSGLLLDFDLDHPDHSFQEIIAHGYFTNHNPNGAYYYGADISVHPDYRGHGVGRKLYEARKAIVQRLNRRGIVAGGLIPGYAQWKTSLSAQEYVDRVVRGELYDATLSFQLRNGFEVHGLLQNYINDPQSDNWGTFIIWPNPSWQPDPPPPLA